MNKIKKALCITYLFSFLVILLTGCSSRYEVPNIQQDSTIVYLPKDTNGINVKILFCKNINAKTDEPVNESSVFKIKEDAKIYAVAKLENVKQNNDHGLMFHIDWIEPSGNSFFTKRIDFLPGDPTQLLTSSITVPPEKREPGNYFLRIYLFRELIAEKGFLLKASSGEVSVLKSIVSADSLAANIILCEKINSKNGRLINPGTVFTIKEKGYVHAVVNLKVVPIDQLNSSSFQNRNITVYAEWIGPDNKSFYRKKIALSLNSSSTIRSAISITPGKRLPGNYSFRFYLLNKLLAEKNFILKKEDKNLIKKNKKEFTDGIKAKIALCRKVNKKTGKLIGTANIFTINNKAKVHAIVNLKNQNTHNSRKLNFYFDWLGPNDSSFYKKRIKIALSDSSSVIKSSISIAPTKRRAGNYKVKFYLSHKMLAEQDFKLITAEKDSAKFKH